MRNDWQGMLEHASLEAFQISFSNPSSSFSSHREGRRGVQVGYQTTFLITPRVLKADQELRFLSCKTYSSSSSNSTNNDYNVNNSSNSSSINISSSSNN